jgi:hypothetical protein
MTSPKWRGLMSGSSASSLAARRPGCSGWIYPKENIVYTCLPAFFSYDTPIENFAFYA